MARIILRNGAGRALAACISAAIASLAMPAKATPFVVDAFSNSSTGGVGLPTLSLTLGQNFSTLASSNDLWSAGALPRWSDAGGLTADRFATGLDESGALLGTKIGMDFGQWGQHGINAPFGSVVGEINGIFQELGLNYTGTAWSTGTLNLYYWDSNNGDNSGQVTVDVTALPISIPEPSSIALLGIGLLGMARIFGKKTEPVAAK